MAAAAMIFQIAVSQPAAFSAYGAETDKSAVVTADTTAGQTTDNTPPASLTDHVLEYDELEDMVHWFSPPVETISANTERNREKYTETLTILEAERDDWRRKAKDAKEDGNAEEYANCQLQEKTCTAAIKSYRKTIKKMDSNASTRSRRRTERSMASTAQSMMISYEMLRQRKETAEQVKVLWEKQANTVRLQNQAGLSTQADILAADQSLSAAGQNLISAEANMETIYQELCCQLGQPTDGTFVIGQVPSSNPAQIGEFHLEEDIKKAISNNSSVMEERGSSKGKGSSAVKEKGDRVKLAEEKTASAMKQLFEEVKQKEQAYQNAKETFEKEEKIYSLLEQKNQLGMLNSQEYLAGQVSYQQQKLNFCLADLELLQAMETYRWAIKGVLDISE